MNIRQPAADIIFQVVEHQRSLQNLFDKNIFSAKDSALLKKIVFGVLRNYFSLATILDSKLKKPFKSKDKFLYFVLLVGLYQIYYLRIPSFAAINETVNICNLIKREWATGLVNAILRTAAREKQTNPNNISNADANSNTHYEHPQLWHKLLKQDWPEDFKNIMLANNTHPPLTIRVTKNSYADVINELTEKNITFNDHEYVENALSIANNTDILKLENFKQGNFIVQDASAQLAASLLELQKGMRVLDACAAPGGKTTHILQLQTDLKEVVAADISATRMQAVQQNLDRLKLHATLKVIDLCEPEQLSSLGNFDRILLDAPCSASGVIRRHPDIKFTRNQNDFEKFAEQQMQLLNNMWQLLNHGGILLYVTCSVMHIENSAVITNFLKQQTNAKLKAITLPVGKSLNVGHQILPSIGNMDGFYFAKLKKIT